MPVTDDYPARGNRFNGKVFGVQIDLGPDNDGHMVDTEHMTHVLMTRQ